MIKTKLGEAVQFKLPLAPAQMNIAWPWGRSCSSRGIGCVLLGIYSQIYIRSGCSSWHRCSMGSTTKCLHLTSWYLLLTMFIVVLVSWLVIVEFINPVCCIPKQNCDSNELVSGLCPSPTFSWLAKTAFLWSMLAYCLCCGSAVHQRSDRLRVGGAQPVRLPAVGEPKDHSWHHAVRGPLLSGHLPQLPTGRLLRP